MNKNLQIHCLVSIISSDLKPMKNEKVKVGITDSHSQIRCPYALFSVCNCITTAVATRGPPRQAPWQASTRVIMEATIWETRTCATFDSSRLVGERSRTALPLLLLKRRSSSCSSSFRHCQKMDSSRRGA